MVLAVVRVTVNSGVGRFVLDCRGGFVGRVRE